MHLKIFLSSPGDVAEERRLALQVIERLGHDLRGLVILEPVAWDVSGAPILATMTPQQAINDGLPKPSECDIVVVIFWSRMGTPLPGTYTKPDGSRYRSGTEWEYEDAMQAARSSGKPDVLVYRRNEEVALKPSDPEFLSKYEQWKQVQDFFGAFNNPDGSIRQGYNTYPTPANFSEQLENHLRSLIQRTLEKRDPALKIEIVEAREVESEDARLLRQIQLAAQRWEENGQSHDFLWVGKQLQTALALVERVKPNLTPTEQDFLTPELDRLMAEIDRVETPHFRRALIGERLNEIGDTRRGVGVNDDGIPDIVWCDVPAGEIQLIASKTDVKAGKLTFAVKPFQIAKYPVTFSQFQAFIEDGGYDDPKWWSGIGKHKDVPSQPRPFGNHPIEFVSWYDATAFCRWLTEKLGLEIRLPMEWEWQQAATYGDANLHYPWGQGWEDIYANTRFSELLRTTAVGMYPHGDTRGGVSDMIGNVWEWCTNELEVPSNIGFSGTKKRSLRGCSCLSRSHKAHVTYRAGNIPSRRAEAHGFRVCT